MMSDKDNLLPWKMRSNRSKNHDKLVDYILLAEFDINTGTSFIKIMLLVTVVEL